ncbi:MAG TPA: nuclear transport factor 2 family protein [Candidatus Cybelea sp.]|nr:nuclear transport factor 2 family protein [Candidatus Cybelea sp.]
MKIVPALCVWLSAWAAIGIAQETMKPNGEEGRIVALESAWDQAEQNKDAAALAGLLADNLVYVDYDGSVSNKRQFLESVKNAEVSSEQIQNEGVSVRLYSNNNVAVSTGIYRDKGVEKGKPFRRRGRFTNVWVKQSGAWQCVASQSTLIAH